MDLKDKISIEEFNGKRFQVRLVEPVDANHKKAIITHYLHNMNNGVAKYYKDDALKYIDELVEYHREEYNLPLVAEEARQYPLAQVLR